MLRSVLVGAVLLTLLASSSRVAGADLSPLKADRLGDSGIIRLTWGTSDPNPFIRYTVLRKTLQTGEFRPIGATASAPVTNVFYDVLTSPGDYIYKVQIDTIGATAEPSKSETQTKSVKIFSPSASPIFMETFDDNRLKLEEWKEPNLKGNWRLESGKFILAPKDELSITPNKTISDQGISLLARVMVPTANNATSDEQTASIGYETTETDADYRLRIVLRHAGGKDTVHIEVTNKVKASNGQAGRTTSWIDPPKAVSWVPDQFVWLRLKIDRRNPTKPIATAWVWKDGDDVPDFGDANTANLSFDFAANGLATAGSRAGTPFLRCDARTASFGEVIIEDLTPPSASGSKQASHRKPHHPLQASSADKLRYMSTLNRSGKDDDTTSIPLLKVYDDLIALSIAHNEALTAFYAHDQQASQAKSHADLLQQGRDPSDPVYQKAEEYKSYPAKLRTHSRKHLEEIEVQLNLIRAEVEQQATTARCVFTTASTLDSKFRNLQGADTELSRVYKQLTCFRGKLDGELKNELTHILCHFPEAQETWPKAMKELEDTIRSLHINLNKPDFRLSVAPPVSERSAEHPDSGHVRRASHHPDQSSSDPPPSISGPDLPPEETILNPGTLVTETNPAPPVEPVESLATETILGTPEPTIRPVAPFFEPHDPPTPRARDLPAHCTTREIPLDDPASLWKLDESETEVTLLRRPGDPDPDDDDMSTEDQKPSRSRGNRRSSRYGHRMPRPVFSDDVQNSTDPDDSNSKPKTPVTQKYLSRIFVFDCPAYFPVVRFKDRLKSYDDEGIRINEGMVLRIAEDGSYEVEFLAEGLSSPATIRLQLKLTINGCPGTLTLPPLELDPSKFARPDGTRNEIARSDDPSTNPWQIVSRGSSPFLRQAFIGANQPHITLRRDGVARIGKGLITTQPLPR